MGTTLAFTDYAVYRRLMEIPETKKGTLSIIPTPKLRAEIVHLVGLISGGGVASPQRDSHLVP